MKNKGKKDNNNSVFSKARAFARSLRLKGKGDNLSFEEARDFASSLQLKGSFSPEEARAFALGLNLKDGNIIPFEEALEVARSLRLKDEGDHFSFEDARYFARSLNLKSVKEWRSYQDENKSDKVPVYPDRFYKGKGWKGWGDFLGTGNTGKSGLKSYEEAREFARSLNLKSVAEWKEYHAKHKPEGIPLDLSVYKNSAKGSGDNL